MQFLLKISSKKVALDLTEEESEIIAATVAELKTSVPNAPTSRTHLIEHRIEIGDTKPIKQRYYPVSGYGLGAGMNAFVGCDWRT